MMKHSEELKHEAVRIALTSVLSRERVSADLGIGKSTLDMAVHLRNPPPGCIFHSDRGRLGFGMISRIIRHQRYCSYDYQKKLQVYGLRPSMSGKGNCYDNASVEAGL